MAYPPESLMIFREELLKAKLEKERLKKEYNLIIDDLTENMDCLKAKLSIQEEMMRSTRKYSMELEQKLKDFKERLEIDEERNSSGYH